MVSRVIGSVVMISISISLVVLAYIVFSGWLFLPLTRPRIEEVKSNLLQLAAIIDRGEGKFKAITVYEFYSGRVTWRITLHVSGMTPGGNPIDVTKELEGTSILVEAPIQARSESPYIIKGDRRCYCNGSDVSVIYLEGNMVRIYARPVISITETTYLGFKALRVYIAAPSYKLMHGSEVLDEMRVAQGDNVALVLNYSNHYPQIRGWMGNTLEITVEIYVDGKKAPIVVDDFCKIEITSDEPFMLLIDIVENQYVFEA